MTPRLTRRAGSARVSRFAGLVAGVTAAIFLAAVTPATAAWAPSSTTRTSGMVKMAKVDRSFTSLLGLGTDGSTYEAVKVINFPTIDYVELTNLSTVPITLAGSVDLASFIATTVQISRCSVPWTTGTCSGTTFTYVSAILSAKMNLNWMTTAMPPGASIHLRVYVGGSIVNKVTLTATPTVARAGGNQTRT